MWEWIEGVYMYRVDQKEVIDPGGMFEVLRVSYKKLSDNPAKDCLPLIKPWQSEWLQYQPQSICGGGGGRQLVNIFTEGLDIILD